jgi:rhodanese-related sulfurtransferase
MSFLFGPKVEEADVRDVADALERGAGVIVDVREPYEYRGGHARDARLVPLGELPVHLDTLPRETPVYLICATGNRSRTAAAFLTRQGFARPINVRGGTAAWQRAGLPMER